MPVGQRTHSVRTMREDWETPAEIFDPLNAEFRFTLDGAANAQNAKVRRFAEIGRPTIWRGERVWLNPPYGYKNLDSWMRRAYEESRDPDTLVVCLVPAHTGQPWWHKWVVGKASEIRWIRGKVKFVGAASCAPFPSCIVIYRPSGARGAGA